MGNEVKNLSNSLNLCKSVGHDNISYFLRIGSDILAPVLCYFIDNAFRLGIFLQSCKKAKLILLFKTIKPNNLTNYLSTNFYLNLFFQNNREINSQKIVFFF